MRVIRPCVSSKLSYELIHVIFPTHQLFIAPARQQ